MKFQDQKSINLTMVYAAAQLSLRPGRASLSNSANHEIHGTAVPSEPRIESVK